MNDVTKIRKKRETRQCDQPKKPVMGMQAISQVDSGYMLLFVFISPKNKSMFIHLCGNL